MPCAPLVRVVVVYVATPLALSATVPPVSATPASLKVTVPVAVAATVAVKVTDWPGVDGFALDVSVVVDAVFTTCVSGADVLVVKIGRAHVSTAVTGKS